MGVHKKEVWERELSGKGSLSEIKEASDKQGVLDGGSKMSEGLVRLLVSLTRRRQQIRFLQGTSPVETVGNPSSSLLVVIFDLLLLLLLLLLLHVVVVGVVVVVAALSGGRHQGHGEQCPVPRLTNRPIHPLPWRRRPRPEGGKKGEKTYFPHVQYTTSFTQHMGTPGTD